MRVRVLFFALCLILTAVNLFSQSSIEGYVYDAKAKYPIVNANVWLEGTNRGEVTNFRGYFAIKNLNAGKYTLVVSYVGYKQWKETIEVSSGDVKKVTVYLEELPYISVEEIVVVGKPFESYNQVDIAGRDITRRAPRDLGDFVKNVPNVSAIKRGGYGLDPLIRGFKYDQINVQVDNGIKIEGACPNRMDPPISHVQAEDLEKIEILKGPYALRFGPNFGGVVNLVMERPERYEKFSLGSVIESGYESNWKGRILRGAIQGGSKIFDFRFSGGTKVYSDYTDGNGSVVPSSFKINDWTAKLGFNLLEMHRVQFSVRRVFGRDVMFPSLMMDERRDNTQMMAFDYAGKNLGKVLNSLTLKVYSSKVYHLMDNEFKPTRDMVIARTEVNTYVFGARAEASVFLGSNVFFIGFDHSKTKKDGYRTRDYISGMMAGKKFTDNVWQNSYIENSGIFAELRTKISELRVIASARLDINRADSRTPDKAFMDSLKIASMSSKHLNLSASAGFIYPVSSNVDVTFLFGSSTRSPNISERFINFLPIGIDRYDYIGNPALKPETNNGVDVILRMQTSIGLFKGDVFYSYVKNFISSQRVNLKPKNMGVLGVKQFINISSASYYGFEFGFSSAFSKAFGFDLNFSGTKAKDNSTGEPLPEIPPFEARTTIYYKLLDGKVMPELAIRAVARKSDVSTSFGETPTPGFMLLNFLLNINYFRFVEISAGVNNIFDKAYYEHLNRKLQVTGTPYYEPGRIFFINIKLKVGEI